MDDSTDQGDTCWSCDADIVAGANYCSQCAAPVSEFRAKQGTGFLSNESTSYISALSDGSISYPSDPQLADELESSLQSQLKLDMREAVTELGIVCAIDEKLLLRSVDAAPLRDAGDEFSTDEITPSMSGLIHLANALDFADENQ